MRQLAKENLVQCERRDSVLAIQVDRHDEQQSKNGERIGAVSRKEHPKTWKTGTAKTKAEQPVLNLGPGTKA